jgi:PLP dependent protein
MDLSESIRQKYELTQEIIINAAQTCGRNPAEIKLVVVSKAQPIQVVEAAVQAGIRVFGENYPEEAIEKIKYFQGKEQLEWHMIGHLQSRKVKMVAESFDCLHSLDSIHLAEKFDQSLGILQRPFPVLLEMNVSGEESKSGWPAWDESRWAELIPSIETIMTLKQLKIIGLMSMPPFFDDPEQARPFFAKLRRLRDYLRQAIVDCSWMELSMGTSVDFGVAVEEGATFVRVGQSILGPRPPRKV